MNILSMTENIEEEIINIRRKIHQNPEISFQEFETAKIIEQYLKKLTNFKVIRVGETGILGILEGKLTDKKKVLALRADMDALPTSETTKLPFASKIPGKMHACGHDVHTSVLLGAAKILSGLTTEFSGIIKFIFQPAEEILGGAKQLINLGVLKNPKVDNIIGFHCWPDIPAGTVGIKKGTMFAGIDAMKLRIKGKSGHTAHPEQGVDPIIISAQILMALQTIVSKEISPVDGVVLGFGQINGGTAPNIIPDEVELSGSIRTINKDTRKTIPERIKRISENIAKGFRGSAELEYSSSCDPVINDENLNKKFEKAAKKLLGDDNVIYLEETSMGGEDFAFYLQEVPGQYFRIGTRNPDEPFYPLHNSNFKVDEKSISIGISALVAMVIEYFS